MHNPPQVCGTCLGFGQMLLPTPGYFSAGPTEPCPDCNATGYRDTPSSNNDEARPLIAYLGEVNE